MVEHHKHQREHWASRFGLILAAMGSAIGLGTLWQFPYVTGENGGGLFVLCYLFFTVVVGIPVLIAELVIGRKSQRAVVGTFSDLSKKSQSWKGLGWLSIIVPLLVLSYYNVVAGWGLNYIFLSLSQFWQGRSPDQITGVFDAMYSSGEISLFFSLMFTLLTIGVVYQGIQKGIEHFSKMMMIGLFIILVGLLAYTLTLDGFGEAFKFVLAPDFSKLKPSGILQALGLSFFTLSLGQGVMITYGSYMKADEDIPKVALIVTAADIVISLLAALMIFPVVFTFGFEPAQEAGLIFKTLPLLFARLPGALVIATTFFLLFVFAGLTSAIGMFEVMVANLMDLYEWSRRKATGWTGLIVAIVGIPSALAGSGSLFATWSDMYPKNFFGTMNDLVNTWLLPIIGLCTAIFVGWSLDRSMLREEFHKGTTLGWLFAAWHFFIRWVVPAAILVVILQQSGLIDIDRFFVSDHQS